MNVKWYLIGFRSQDEKRSKEKDKKETYGKCYYALGKNLIRHIRIFADVDLYVQPSSI